MAIDFNPQFQAALKLLETDQNAVLLTGKAGTGKSTLLRHFRATTNKKIAMLAPTGVAALNVGGETIHSFFSLAPNPHPEDLRRKQLPKEKLNLVRKLDAIVIDEISMVRADLLDFVDIRLRKAMHLDIPFGGVQLIMIGDLYQLPPVLPTAERAAFLSEYESPYFFSSKVMRELQPQLRHIELNQIYRQQDTQFVDVLNRIRTNTATSADISHINSRYDEYFEMDLNDFAIYLATTNKIVDDVNAYKLAELPSQKRIYRATESGKFPNSAKPNPEVLELKVGAQVMFLNNQKEEGSTEYLWVNGTLGKITDILEDEKLGDVLKVELINGREVEVAPYTWKLEKYSYDDVLDKVVQQTEGTYTQFPLKLAWALTIHKSQGQTFEHLIIDFGNWVFDYGQVYVALSRAVALSGVRLRRPLQMRDIKVDPQITEFLDRLKSDN